MEETQTPAPPEERLEEAGPDLSELRWQSRDMFPMGITFFGTIREAGGYVVESRRLAGVPLRFALEQAIEFADSSALLVALLEASPIYQGPDRILLESGAKPPPIGEYPLFLDPTQEAPVAYFRKTSRETFEAEVSWKAKFSQWKTGPVIL